MLMEEFLHHRLDVSKPRQNNGINYLSLNWWVKTGFQEKTINNYQLLFLPEFLKGSRFSYQLLSTPACFVSPRVLGRLWAPSTRWIGQARCLDKGTTAGSRNFTPPEKPNENISKGWISRLDLEVRLEFFTLFFVFGKKKRADQVPPLHLKLLAADLRNAPAMSHRGKNACCGLRFAPIFGNKLPKNNPPKVLKATAALLLGSMLLLLAVSS